MGTESKHVLGRFSAENVTFKSFITITFSIKLLTQLGNRLSLGGGLIEKWEDLKLNRHPAVDHLRRSFSTNRRCFSCFSYLWTDRKGTKLSKLDLYLSVKSPSTLHSWQQRGRFLWKKKIVRSWGDLGLVIIVSCLRPSTQDWKIGRLIGRVR